MNIQKEKVRKELVSLCLGEFTAVLSIWFCFFLLKNRLGDVNSLVIILYPLTHLMVPHVVQRIEQLCGQHAAATAHFQHHLAAAHQRRILQPRGNLPGQGGAKKRREFRRRHEVTSRPKHLKCCSGLVLTRLTVSPFSISCSILFLSESLDRKTHV